MKSGKWGCHYGNILQKFMGNEVLKRSTEKMFSHQQAHANSSFGEFAWVCCFLSFIFLFGINKLRWIIIRIEVAYHRGTGLDRIEYGLSNGVWQVDASM